MGPFIAFDCKGVQASGSDVIVLVALKHLYEKSLWGIFTFMGKIFFIRQQDKYYCMILCQYSIVYFTNIFQKVGLLVLLAILLKVKSSAMLKYVDWRRFQYTYLISREKIFS